MLIISCRDRKTSDIIDIIPFVFADYGALDAAQAQHVADVIADVDGQQSSPCTPPTNAPRPNILFFLADDLGELNGDVVAYFFNCAECKGPL